MIVLAKHTTPLDCNPKQRLSDYLLGVFPQLPSRKSIKKAFQKQKILIHNQPAHSGWWVKPNTEIILLELEASPNKVFELKLNVIYEDDYLAAVHKPAGYSTSGNLFQSIENALPFNLQQSEAIDKLARPRVVHRLDALTTGILIAAKTKTARIELGRQFEQKTIQKTYWAIAMGKMPQQKGIIDTPIQQKAAQTHYEVIQTVPSLKSQWLNLVKLHPTTGRTHQIRIHLASIGCPILGDKVYGTTGNILKKKGMFLLAKSICFTHPIHHTKIELHTETPAKFESILVKEKRRWEQFNTPQK